MRILAISGSLRAASSNTALLRALALLASPPLEISIYEGLAGIPPFNPDLDSEPGPEPVEAFREALRRADAVVFSTPEYAHGIPGSLKNLLDWVVGSGELSEKPVALIHASARGEHAQAALREVLRTMNARLFNDLETTLALMGQPRSPAEIAGDPEHSAQILAFLQKLAVSL